jgi:hypothetical protein
MVAINCQYHPIPVWFFEFGEFGAKDFIEKMEEKKELEKKAKKGTTTRLSHLGS